MLVFFWLCFLFVYCFWTVEGTSSEPGVFGKRSEVTETQLFHSKWLQKIDAKQENHEKMCMVRLLSGA